MFRMYERQEKEEAYHLARGERTYTVPATLNILRELDLEQRLWNISKIHNSVTNVKAHA